MLVSAHADAHCVTTDARLDDPIAHTPNNVA